MTCQDCSSCTPAARHELPFTHSVVLKELAWSALYSGISALTMAALLLISVSGVSFISLLGPLIPLAFTLAVVVTTVQRLNSKFGVAQGKKPTLSTFISAVVGLGHVGVAAVMLLALFFLVMCGATTGCFTVEELTKTSNLLLIGYILVIQPLGLAIGVLFADFLMRRLNPHL